jgi:regulator of sirC expression with transglutaminase-like and TPR domain
MKPKFTVFDIARHLGLAIEYSADLPGQFYGQLEQRDEPRYILINSNQPEFEQHFTIAHELAHYVLHHNRPRRKISNWFLNRQWKIKRLDKACRVTKRFLPVMFHREWEADIWAMLLLLQISARDDLTKYIEHHPEKTGWFLIAAVISCYKNSMRWLAKPFTPAANV